MPIIETKPDKQVWAFTDTATNKQAFVTRYHKEAWKGMPRTPFGLNHKWYQVEVNGTAIGKPFETLKEAKESAKEWLANQ